MALGVEVTKASLDLKAAQAVLKMRSALYHTETVAKWLASYPVVGGIDPLTQEPFGYNADEAYALRFYFEGVDAFRIGNINLLEAGRKMTGLE